MNKPREVNLDNQTDHAREQSDIANGFFIFALHIVLIGNLLGNSLVLYVVYRQWKNVRQRVTSFLIGNLACIDLLVAVLVLLSIIKAFRGTGGLTSTKCQIDGFLANLVGSASIPTMAVIAIDRYMAIILNHGRRLKLPVARVIIACIWIVAILISLFPILFWGKYHRTEKSTQCKPNSGGFFVFLAIVAFVIPLVTMIFCYVKVFLKIQAHKRMLSSLKGNNSSIKTEFKTTKIVFTVLIIFVVLWTPYVVVYVASSNSDKDSIPPTFFKFCGFLTAMHSMCNSIIYFSMNKRFRRCAVTLLRQIFSCVLPTSEHSATTGSATCGKSSCSVKGERPCSMGTSQQISLGQAAELSKV